jgi:gluconate 5-dehydrogenase
MKNLFDLTGKVAVITGASSGIGFHIARELSDQGADVAILSRRMDNLEALAEEIASKGGKALPVKCDVTNEAEVIEAVNKVIGKFGKIDILFNNAGIATATPVDATDLSSWNQVLNTNLNGVFLMTKHVVKHMKERKYGRIINTSSIYGLIGDKFIPVHAYEATKGAIISLTRGLAASWGQFGITVNAIGPSLFETEMTKNTLFAQQEWMKLYVTNCPMGRPGKIEELTGAVVYFASDASGYTTGQTLFVDGGMSAV